MSGMETNDFKDEDSVRPVATGGLRRVFKQRNKRHETRLITRRHHEGDPASAAESDDNEEPVPVNQTSHHYTLNMPAPAPAPSELPYILLGRVLYPGSMNIDLIYD